jgi:hypothetical protein
VTHEAVLDFARRHGLPPPLCLSETAKVASQQSRFPEQSDDQHKVGRSDRGDRQPNDKSAQLKTPSDAMIIRANRAAYDAAEAAGKKPPNEKQLPDHALPILEGQGYTASKRRIQRLGQLEEFKRRRRKPGKTLKSERRKK